MSQKIKQENLQNSNVTPHNTPDSTEYKPKGLTLVEHVLTIGHMPLNIVFQARSYSHIFVNVDVYGPYSNDFTPARYLRPCDPTTLTGRQRVHSLFSQRELFKVLTHLLDSPIELNRIVLSYLNLHPCDSCPMLVTPFKRLEYGSYMVDFPLFEFKHVGKSKQWILDEPHNQLKSHFGDTCDSDGLLQCWECSFLARGMLRLMYNLTISQDTTYSFHEIKHNLDGTWNRCFYGQILKQFLSYDAYTKNITFKALSCNCGRLYQFDILYPICKKYDEKRRAA